MRVEKIALAVFLALPKKERGTLGEFSEEWGVSRQTLSAWQKEKDVQRLRLEFMLSVLQEHTPDILLNLAEAAKTPITVANPVPAATLWLKFVEDWKETIKADPEMPVVHFGFPPSQFIKPEGATPSPPKKKSVQEALKRAARAA
jgi:DNA-binding XRE family transcriptional regulator